MKIRRLGAQLLYADGQTDRHDETNSCFSQFRLRAPKYLFLCTSFSRGQNFSLEWNQFKKFGLFVRNSIQSLSTTKFHTVSLNYKIPYSLSQLQNSIQSLSTTKFHTVSLNYKIPYSLSQLQNSIQSLSTTKVSSTYFVNYFNYLIHSQTKPLRHLWEQKASTAHPTSLYWTLLRPLNTGVHSAGPRERSPCLLVMLLGTLPCFHSPTFHNVLIGAPGSHDATSGAPGSSLSYSFILFSFHFLSLFVCLYASIFLNYVFYCCVYVFIL